MLTEYSNISSLPPPIYPSRCHPFFPKVNAPHRPVQSKIDIHSLQSKFSLPMDWIWFYEFTNNTASGYSKLSRITEIPQISENEVWFFKPEFGWISVDCDLLPKIANEYQQDLHQITSRQGYRIVWLNDTVKENNFLNNETIFIALFERFNQNIFTIETQISIIDDSILGFLDWQSISEIMRLFTCRYASQMTKMYNSEKDYELLRANRIPETAINLLKNGCLTNTETCINQCSGNILYILWKKFIIDKFKNSYTTTIQFMKAYDRGGYRNHRQYSRVANTDLFPL